MKSRGFRISIAKIVFLVLLIIALVMGGMVWIDFLGILDVKSRIAPIISILRFKKTVPVEEIAVPVLLDSERLDKERQAIAVAQGELERIRGELSRREVELIQREEVLSEKEKSVDERQKSLSIAINQYENKIANLEQTARYMMGMPPVDAVAIMDEYDVKDLVDLLRTSERLSQEADEVSLVAYWLSIMPDRNRAALIQRLLVEKPGLTLDE